jgi:hypothetical protein
VAAIPKSFAVPPLESGALTNFSGGPNFRDAPSELGATETYGSWNVTYDERGGASSRLGYAKRNSSVLGNGTTEFVVNDFYSQIAGVFLTQVGPKLYRNDNTSSVHTFSTSGCCTFTEIAGKIVVAHPVDGMYTSTDGTTWTALDVLGVCTIDLDTLGVCTIDIATPGLVHLTAHGRNADDPVTFTTTGALPTGLAVATVYYVIAAGLTANAFEVAATVGGAAINTSGTQSGVHTLHAGTPGLVHLTAHGRVAGDTVTFTTTGALPTGLTAGTVYYVLSAGLTANAFEVSATAGGAPIDKSGSQSGVHTLHTANVPAAATCVVSWQNKLFVGLADGTVHWSALADLTRWASTDFNAIWTLDQQPIVALAVGSGQDIQGRPGLLVFKQGSVYRINNAATGAYTVISGTEGAASPKAVVGVGARVCWIGQRGIFWWREDQPSPVAAGDSLQPLWQSSQLSFANQAGWCAGRRLNRVLFSCSTLNSGVNDIAFELHPDQGWVAPRSDAVTCYAHSADLNDRVCGGSPVHPGQAYTLSTTGADDGTAISWWLQTRWVTPSGGYQASIWQLRLHGRGTGSVVVRRNFEASGGTSYPFNLAAPVPLYDSGLTYDSGVVYGDSVAEETQAVYDLGVVRQFSLYFAGTSTTTVTGRDLFGAAPAAAVGAFGMFQLEYLFTPMGLT